MTPKDAIERRAHWYAARAGFRIDRRCGPGPDVPVLVLHGLGGDRDQLWPWFADGRRTVIAPDQRAHGHWPFTLTPAELDFEQLARDQLRLLDRLGHPVASVAGVSMGAGVAVAMARLAPSRVAALLLLRPAWLDRPFPPNLDILVRVGELLDRWDGAELLRALTGTREYQDLAAMSAAAAASVRAQIDQSGARALSLRLRHLPGSVPMADLGELSAIQVPAAVVGAAGDPMHPAAIATVWADALPHASYDEVPSRDLSPTGYEAALREHCTRFAGAL